MLVVRARMFYSYVDHKGYLSSVIFKFSMKYTPGVCFSHPISFSCIILSSTNEPLCLFADSVTRKDYDEYLQLFMSE